MALFHFLFTHADEFSIKLSAVNCEHGLRGAESVADSDFVKNLCKDYGVPLFFYSEDCAALSKKRKESVETAARFFRYSVFNKILSEGKADAIATAHHANDNAETVLFNLCRGSALSGLSGITEREGFIRPMLRVSKREIEKYISENSLPYRTDSSNAEDDVTRNALRLNILPALEKQIPGAVKNISRFALTAKSDDDFLYSLAEEKLSFSDGAAAIEPCEYPLFSRAVILAMKKMGVEKDYTGEHVRSVYSLLGKQTSAKISLPKGIFAVNEYGKIKIYFSREKNGAEIPLGLGENRIGESVVRIDKTPGGLRFDLKKLPQCAVLRFRRDGDFFKKFGGAGKKLKEFFNEKKIPSAERDFIPLIAVGKEIYCVCGIEISDKLRTDENSEIYYIHISNK